MDVPVDVGVTVGVGVAGSVVVSVGVGVAVTVTVEVAVKRGVGWRSGGIAVGGGVPRRTTVGVGLGVIRGTAVGVSVGQGAGTGLWADAEVVPTRADEAASARSPIVACIPRTDSQDPCQRFRFQAARERERTLLLSATMDSNPLPSPSVALFGEALMDQLPGGPVPGGAPLNVARHLRAFGLAPILITRLGIDAAGESLLSSMVEWGLDTSGVQLDSARDTGRVLVHREGEEHRFEIPHEQAFDFIDAEAAVEALPSPQPALLYFGTLAQRTEESRHALATLLSRFEGERFLDVNLRLPWYSAGWLERSLEETDVLKLSESELEILAWLCALPWDEAARAAQLMKRYAIRRVVVTAGERGATLYDAGGTEARVDGTALASGFVDSVGAGDAFAAVQLLAIAHGWSPGLALERADAFARAICRIRGAIPGADDLYEPFRVSWRLSDPDEVQR